jgi:hypothetical protein
MQSTSLGACTPVLYHVLACCVAAAGVATVKLEVAMPYDDGGLPMLGCIVLRQENWLGEYGDATVTLLPRSGDGVVELIGLIPATGYRCTPYCHTCHLATFVLSQLFTLPYQPALFEVTSSVFLPVPSARSTGLCYFGLDCGVLRYFYCHALGTYS